MHTRALMTGIVLLAGLGLGIGTGCSFDACGSEDVEFELLAPGDALELHITACTDHGATDVDIDLDMSVLANGTPTTGLALIVDGMTLSPEDKSWTTRFFYENVGEQCEEGKRIVLRRVDSDDAVSYSGSLSVRVAAPSRRSCELSVSVTPL